MSDEVLSSPYGDLVRQLLAGEIEPEAAGLEAVNLMEKLKDPGPAGLSLSFRGLSDSEADLLARFVRAAEDELLRRLGSGPDVA
jgi:hypothetical protein